MPSNIHTPVHSKGTHTHTRTHTHTAAAAATVALFGSSRCQMSAVRNTPSWGLMGSDAQYHWAYLCIGTKSNFKGAVCLVTRTNCCVIMTNFSLCFVSREPFVTSGQGPQMKTSFLFSLNLACLQNCSLFLHRPCQINKLINK